MAFKLYISGNVLYIVDTVTNIQYEGKAKDCLHRRIELSSTDFYFSGLNNLPENKVIPFADIQDKNGDPISNTYASAQLLSDYLDTELGKSSSQAGEAITNANGTYQDFGNQRMMRGTSINGTVTLPGLFANANYQLIVSSNSNDNSGTYLVNANSKTESSFTVIRNINNTVTIIQGNFPFDWVAWGDKP